MKHIYAIIFTLLFGYLFGQPTITSSWAPQAGDIIVGFVDSGITTNLSPGDSGDNVDWDFSAIEGTGNITPIDLIYINASESEFVNLFPDANLALQPVVPDPEFQFASFYQVNDNMIILYGNATESSNTIYSDALVSMSFPLDFNDSFSDDYEGITTSDNFQSFNSGTATLTYDGFGNISTPFASYSDVLRIKTEQTIRDSTSISEGTYSLSEINSTSYTWVKENINNSIASYVISSGQSTTVVEGLDPNITEIPETISFTWSNLEEPSVVVEQEFSDFKILNSGPNPTNDLFSVRLNSDKAKQLDVVLVNALGLQVMSNKQQLHLGENEISLDLESLPPGQYTLQIKDKLAFQSFQLIKLNK